MEFSIHALSRAHTHTHINIPFIQNYKTTKALLYKIYRYPFYETNIHLKDALIPLKKKKTVSEVVIFTQEMT